MTLLSLAPIVIDIVMKVEQLVAGAKKGQVKKQVALSILESTIDAADKVKPGAGDVKEQILLSADKLIDGTVYALNAAGVLNEKVKIDLSPKGGVR
ncbi:MAG: hypothetical protein QXI19_10285 [Candidatus Caldarchaeum sp.]